MTRVWCGVPVTPVVATAQRLLARTLRERAGMEVTAAGTATDADVILDIQPGIGTEGFRIVGGVGEPVRVIGNDARGLLYGVGRLLRSSSYAAGRLVPGTWRGISVPRRAVRGMYFATHFHNWYHVAPLDEVIRYVEELALWGCNALSVWFDMHHYAAFMDPAAQRMLERLHAILQAANRAGMGASLTMLVNEAYASSPPDLRADWTAGHDGYFAPPGDHYHVELCPSKPGGLDLILRWRDEMLAAFSDLDLEYIWLWPYDQGGCTCSRCAPWGVNGFLRTAAEVARLVRARFPRVKVVLSTWYFDHFVRGEWAGLAEIFRCRRPEWVNYLLIDDFGGFPSYPLAHGVPGGFPVIGFPEISMEGMSPWGAFGANPRPRHWHRYHALTRELLNGSFPYSEGIFEDLNKVLHLQWGWDSDRAMEEIVGAYAAAHFAPEVADGLLSAALMLEEDLGLHAERDAAGALRYRTSALAHADACLALMNDLERRLPEDIRRSWRWCLLWLRAALDAELKRTGGQPGARSDSLLQEVAALNHSEGAHAFLRPPV